MNNSLLKYTVNSEEYKFFYREEILFESTKNNPFLYLSVEKEGVKKLLPFNEFEIEKEEENLLEIKFFAVSCVVKIAINCDENNVFFSLKKIGRTDDRLYIRLNKKDTRTVGLGLNVIKQLDKEKIGILDRLKKKKKDKEYINADNTLNFYVVNGYYFSNCNINDWELEIDKSVILSSAQEKIEFRLEYNKKFSFLQQKSYKLLKINFSDIEKVLESDYNGVITEYDTDIKTPYIINKIRRNKSVFITLSPVVKDTDYDYDSFDKSTMIKVSKGYVTDITDKKNERAFMNRIRKICDLNPDGIYVDEKEVDLDGNVILKNALFYENLHSLIKTVLCEYTQKYIIYNKLNSSDIIENPIETKEEKKKDSLIFSYKKDLKIIKELYAINYEDIRKKENIYINNLLFSGYKSYFYECAPSDVPELIYQGKLQLIVDNSKILKNKRFRKKTPKN